MAASASTKAALRDLVAHEFLRQRRAVSSRGGAAQGRAQQGLLEAAAITIERETQQRRDHAQQPQQPPRPAREVAQHQREQRVTTGDRAVQIEYGDGHAASRS